MVYEINPPFILPWFIEKTILEKSINGRVYPTSIASIFCIFELYDVITIVMIVYHLAELICIVICIFGISSILIL